MNELERWLDARLLPRTTRSVTLTDAGETCLRRSQQMLALMENVVAKKGQFQFISGTSQRKSALSPSNHISTATPALATRCQAAFFHEFTEFTIRACSASFAQAHALAGIGAAFKTIWAGIEQAIEGVALRLTSALVTFAPFTRRGSCLRAEGA